MVLRVYNRTPPSVCTVVGPVVTYGPEIYCATGSPDETGVGRDVLKTRVREREGGCGGGKRESGSDREKVRVMEG